MGDGGGEEDGEGSEEVLRHGRDSLVEPASSSPRVRRFVVLFIQEGRMKLKGMCDEKTRDEHGPILRCSGDHELFRHVAAREAGTSIPPRFDAEYYSGAWSIPAPRNWSCPKRSSRSLDCPPWKSKIKVKYADGRSGFRKEVGGVLRQASRPRRNLHRGRRTEAHDSVDRRHRLGGLGFPVDCENNVWCRAIRIII